MPTNYIVEVKEEYQIVFIYFEKTFAFSFLLRMKREVNTKAFIFSFYFIIQIVTLEMLQTFFPLMTK